MPLLPMGNTGFLILLQRMREFVPACEDCRAPVTRRYRLAHCCSNVAKSAQVRLIMRLMNQRTLTKMAEEDGANLDGSERLRGRGRTGLDELPAAVTWYMCAR